MGVSVTIPYTAIPGPVTVSGAETVTGTFTAAGTFAHSGANAGFFGHAPAARPGAIVAPSVPSAGYVQAEAQSTVDAVNSLRAALTALGLTA